MTYDQMAAATNGGGYDVEVKLTEDAESSLIAEEDRGDTGTTSLDHGNRVTVHWKSGTLTRVDIEELEIA